jgi:hypothetical protein
VLPGVTPADPGDVGEPDPILAGALASGDTAGEKSAEMSVPVLVDAAGARALPAFTGTAGLLAWRSDARPVPMPGARVVAGAVDEGYDAVVVDVAGPHPLQLTGPVLGRLAEAARRLLAGEGGTVTVLEAAEDDADRS